MENKVSYTATEFWELFDKIQEDKRAKVINPNGMRPGLWSVQVGSVYIHAMEGGGGYDQSIYVTKREVDLYSIVICTENILYCAERIYGRNDTESGDYTLSQVAALLEGRAVVGDDMTIKSINKDGRLEGVEALAELAKQI